MILLAFFCDVSSRMAGYRQLARAIANGESFLGFSPASYGQNGNRPYQGSCKGGHYIVTPLQDGRSSPPVNFHEESLLEVMVLDETGDRVWNLLNRHGREGIRKFAIPAHQRLVFPASNSATATA